VPGAYTKDMAGAPLKTESGAGRCWTYADYKDWELKPGERYEIIYGETAVTRSYGEKDKLALASLPGLCIDLEAVFEE